MTFLNDDVTYITTKVTAEGRRRIARGDFNIKYFQIGDSEFEYDNAETKQKLTTPTEESAGLKTPYLLDKTSGITYGVPFSKSKTKTVIRQISSDLNNHPLTHAVLWSKGVIGMGHRGVDLSLLSTKNMFGYTTRRDQNLSNAFGELIGGFRNNMITSVIYDSENKAIYQYPDEIRDICVFYFKGDGDKFFYDDKFLVNENNFELHIPGLRYHKTDNNTFYAEDEQYYLNSNHSMTRIGFKFLKDGVGNRVGKIFHDYKMIIIDEPELVAVMENKTNRKYTLPIPKTKLVGGDENSLFNRNNNDTVFVTYMLRNSDDSNPIPLPCNYFKKIVMDSGLGIIRPTDSNYNISFEMDINELEHLDGIDFDEFYILIQKTDGSLPTPTEWKIVDVTSRIEKRGKYFTVSELAAAKIIIDGDDYVGTPIFELVRYHNEGEVMTMFGNEELFKGRIELEVATVIEEMCYHITLPDSQFNITQNGTYRTGDKFITEVALLNDKRQTMVVGKLQFPVRRNGSQILEVKMDF